MKRNAIKKLNNNHNKDLVKYSIKEMRIKIISRA